MLKLCRTRLLGIGQAGVIAFILYLCSACQANISPSPSATLISPVPAPSLAALPTTVATASPSPTTNPSPSVDVETTAEASLEPSTTVAASTLSSTGPWLVFRKATNDGDVNLILLDQDGAGRAQIRVSECVSKDQIPIEESPANRLVMLDGETYLVNPEKAKAWSVYEPRYPCSTYFSKSEQDGLLAKIYPATEGSILELRVYKLPEGKQLYSAPVSQCSGSQETCSPDDLTRAPRWDPGGRNLAFPVVVGNGASSLYIYNVEHDQAQQLARFQGSIGDIWWSPDGTRIILGISLTGEPVSISSLWELSLVGGEPHLIYSLENPFPQEIVEWLDNDRFLVCDGSLKHVVSEGAFNLRLVEISSHTVKTLFDDGFVAVELDRKTETVAIFAIAYNSHTEDGYYLVSMADLKPRFIGPPVGNQIKWQEDLRVFVTDTACQEGGKGYQAFDAKGNWRCVQVPPPADRSASEIQLSPDGQWQAVWKRWAMGSAQRGTANQVLIETPSEVIWQPDSGGLFFIVKGALYHVSLPDFILKDLGVQIKEYQSSSDQNVYQWIS